MHGVVVEWRAAAGGAEGAVALGTAGAARDLGQLRGVQAAELIAVELAVGRKRNVFDVEIEETMIASPPDRRASIA